MSATWMLGWFLAASERGPETRLLAVLAFSARLFFCTRPLLTAGVLVVSGFFAMLSPLRVVIASLVEQGAGGDASGVYGR